MVESIGSRWLFQGDQVIPKKVMLGLPDRTLGQDHGQGRGDILDVAGGRAADHFTQADAVAVVVKLHGQGAADDFGQPVQGVEGVIAEPLPIILPFSSQSRFVVIPGREGKQSVIVIIGIGG